jgi:hypothetical protein
MTTKEKAKAYDAMQLVNRFNEQFELGSKVQLRKMASKNSQYIECTVESAAFLSSSNEPVAFFEEISGYFSIDPNFIKY